MKSSRTNRSSWLLLFYFDTFCLVWFSPSSSSVLHPKPRILWSFCLLFFLWCVFHHWRCFDPVGVSSRANSLSSFSVFSSFSLSLSCFRFLLITEFFKTNTSNADYFLWSKSTRDWTWRTSQWTKKNWKTIEWFFAWRTTVFSFSFFLSLGHLLINDCVRFFSFFFYYYYYYSVMLFVYIYISIVDARFLFYMCSKKKSRTKRIELLKISQSLETIVLSLKVMFLSHRSRNPKIIRARKLVFSGRWQISGKCLYVKTKTLMIGLLKTWYKK